MANIEKFRIPTPVGRLLGMLPKRPGSQLFVTGLNLTLAPHLPVDTCAMLEGRSLRIEVADAGMRFDYTWRENGFRAFSEKARAPGAWTRPPAACSGGNSPYR